MPPDALRHPNGTPIEAVRTLPIHSVLEGMDGKWSHSEARQIMPSLLSSPVPRNILKGHGQPGSEPCFLRFCRPGGGILVSQDPR